ncbi:MAG: MBL fold metallo-hydrolase [Clostridiales bacterium]|nr:MBL fold metallo-hydrolase [Candidatus Blautia equi]
MRIRMYNVGYGDCFCLRDKKKNLLVDFGTSNGRIEGRPRRDIFDMVLSDLMSIENKNLLLTHFHLDHLSGLLYLMKHRRGSFDFGTIYLPDVFSSPEKSRTLALLLLSDLRKDSFLPSKQVSLYALVEALSSRIGKTKIAFLSRGRSFEGKYTALWPDHDEIGAMTERILVPLEKEHSWILKSVLAFAEKLRQMICSMAEDGTGEKPYAISALEQEFRDLRSMPEFRQLMDAVDAEDAEKWDIKNSISVVFQNSEDSEWNLLFTGDISGEYMKKIAGNYDGTLPLHEHYWCIKVPHHGTGSHYYNFADYTPENLLISNGIYHTLGKKQAKAARTTTEYAGMFHTWDVTMWCSNSSCCDGFRDGCSCKECEIISPRYYLDIR